MPCIFTGHLGSWLLDGPFPEYYILTPLISFHFGWVAPLDLQFGSFKNRSHRRPKYTGSCPSLRPAPIGRDDHRDSFIGNGFCHPVGHWGQTPFSPGAPRELDFSQLFRPTPRVSIQRCPLCKNLISPNSANRCVFCPTTSRATRHFSSIHPGHLLDLVRPSF